MYRLSSKCRDKRTLQYYIISLFCTHFIFSDITSEKSFLNAREWMASAKEVISVDRNYSADEMDSIVFMLVGNKLDLADDDIRR